MVQPCEKSEWNQKEKILLRPKKKKRGNYSEKNYLKTDPLDVFTRMTLWRRSNNLYYFLF